MYIARADVFADAVASGSLTDGPILLVPRCGALPAEVVGHLSSVATDRVVALGGSQAVCDQLLDDAGALVSEGAPPPTPDLGELLYTWSRSARSFDLATGEETAITPVGDADLGVGWDFTELAWSENDFIANTAEITLADLDTGAVEERFTVGFNTRSAPLVAPGGEVLGVLDVERDENGNTVGGGRRDLVLMDRSGESSHRLSGLKDFTWTPSGDLVVSIEVDPPSLVRVDGGFLDGEDVQVTLIREFVDFANLPTELTVYLPTARRSSTATATTCSRHRWTAPAITGS